MLGFRGGVSNWTSKPSFNWNGTPQKNSLMPLIPKTHQISIKLNLVSWGTEGLEIGNTWALAKEWRCCRRELRDYQLWVCAHSSWPDPLLFPSPARFGFWLPICFTLTVPLTITEKSCGLEGEGTNLTRPVGLGTEKREIEYGESFHFPDHWQDL